MNLTLVVEVSEFLYVSVSLPVSQRRPIPAISTPPHLRTRVKRTQRDGFHGFYEAVMDPPDKTAPHLTLLMLSWLPLQPNPYG
jgi:hypothetical protein